MQYSLLAMLVLFSWAQEEGGQRLPVEAPSSRLVVNVITVGVMPDGGPELITLEMPARSAPSDAAIPQPVRPPRGVDFRAMAVARENFDRWLFADERSQEERRRHLEEILDAKILLADLEHKLTLTAQQQSKLRVAGRGDIKRFFDQVEDKRAQFETERQKYKTGLAALRRLAPIRQIYTEGPFGDGSLFAKMLLKVKEERRAGLSSASGDPLMRLSTPGSGPTTRRQR
jgi:hypothetical protein